MTRPSWEDVRRKLLEHGWFESEERPKTALAIRRVTEQMPDDYLEFLLSMVDILIAPSPGDLGSVMKVPSSLALPRRADYEDEGAWEKAVLWATQVEQDNVAIYLSPYLERRAQRAVDFTVAHEFAHAVLHWAFQDDEYEREVGADDLAAEWGFPRPRA